MKSKEEMRDEVIALHPYKVPGKPETYGEYNEGWEDACYVFEDYLKIFSDQENAELKEKYNALDMAATKWRSERDNLLLEAKNLRRRLSDCERKRITGERI